ncbi:MAG: methylmalonyl Co-A mutase-associated GTPase MeaB, partial [Bdellovibrionota bacterium]
QAPTVAIVAIDPSSPFSGGAVLGDRIRMQNHYADPGVYIRSLGTRGHHGGLSQATREVVLALDAAGYAIILVETVGVGQTELEVLDLADTTTVVLVPESGDSIQVMKAGLMEIADVFAVNKCDRPEADKMERELTNLVALNHEMSHASWANPVIQTQATSDRGTKALVEAIRAHQKHLAQSGERHKKARNNVIREAQEILLEKTRRQVVQMFSSGEMDQEIQEVLERKSNPYRLAESLLRRQSES